MPHYQNTKFDRILSIGIYTYIPIYLLIDNFELIYFVKFTLAEI